MAKITSNKNAFFIIMRDNITVIYKLFDTKVGLREFEPRLQELQSYVINQAKLQLPNTKNYIKTLTF